MSAIRSAKSFGIYYGGEGLGMLLATLAGMSFGRKCILAILMVLSSASWASLQPNLLIINLGDDSSQEVRGLFESAANRFAQAYAKNGYRVFLVQPGPDVLKRTMGTLVGIPDGGLALEIIGHGNFLPTNQQYSNLDLARFPLKPIFTPNGSVQNKSFAFVNGIGQKLPTWLAQSLGVGDVTAIVDFYQKRFPKALVRISSNSCFGGAAAQQLAFLPGVMTFSMASDSAVSVLKSSFLSQAQSDVSFASSVEAAQGKEDSHLQIFDRAREEYLNNYSEIPLDELSIPRNPLDSFALGWCSHQSLSKDSPSLKNPSLDLYFGRTLSLNQSLVEALNRKAGCHVLEPRRYPIAQERLEHLAWSLVDEIEKRIDQLIDIKSLKVTLYEYIGKGSALEAKMYYRGLINNIRAQCRDSSFPVYCVEKMVNQANVSRLLDSTNPQGIAAPAESAECEITGHTLFKDSCWGEWSNNLVLKHPRRAVGFLYAFKDFVVTQSAKCLNKLDQVNAYRTCFNEFLNRAHPTDKRKFEELVRNVNRPLGKLTKD